MSGQLGRGQLGSLQLGGQNSAPTSAWSADSKASCAWNPLASLRWTCNSPADAGWDSLAATYTSQLGRARLGKLQLGAVEPRFIGAAWEARQLQSCSWTGATSTTWPASAKQSCFWIPGYINVWVSLNDAICSWTGSLGAHITSGWVLEAGQECEWEVVNTDPGDWESEQIQLCEWVPTIQAIPEACLTGDGLPTGASRGANYCF